MRDGARAVKHPPPEPSRIAKAELEQARRDWGPISYVEALTAAQEAAKRLRELCPALEAR